MTKTFTIDDIEYTFTEVTAVPDCCLDTGERSDGILVEWTDDNGGERLQYVVFWYDLPETAEDFAAMCDEPSAWDSDWEVLETVEAR